MKKGGRSILGHTGDITSQMCPQCVPMERPHVLTMALLFTVSLCLAGCVKRSILIETDPPGAQLWINEHEIGKTPVLYEFITHGRYKFRLEKPGFKPITAREMIRAPIYEWIGIDFVAEWVLPLHLKDFHHFRYTLNSQPPAEQAERQPSVDLQKIVAQLQDPKPEKRRLACVELAKLREQSTAAAVEAATRDSSPIVRAAALGTFRAIAQLQSIERLLEALRADPNREVRWQAAIELEVLADPRAVPALIQALKGRDPLVRVGAAEALKGIPDAAALQPLIRALKDPDPGVRRAATEAIGKIGDRAAVPALIKMLFHHDVRTRRKAVEALALLKDPASGPALVKTFNDYDRHVRGKATQALINFGDQQVVPMLIRRLRSWRPWVREHAAQVLGGLKPPQAIEPLEKALKPEKDLPAHNQMVLALRALGVSTKVPLWEEKIKPVDKNAPAQSRHKKGSLANNA